MKLTPYDIKKLGRFWNGRSDNLALLKEFSESSHQCVEVRDFTQKDAKSCCGSLAASIKRFRMGHIKVRYCKGKVYLINLNK